MEQKVAILVGGINFHVRSYMDKGSMQQIDPLLMATCKAPFLVLPVLDYLRQLSTVYNEFSVGIYAPCLQLHGFSQGYTEFSLHSFCRVQLIPR